MSDIVISGTGLFVPPFIVSNDELVDAYNAYVNQFNQDHAAEIEAGTVAALPLSSSEFIEKASGIKARYAMYKEGMLDVNRMKPVFPYAASDNDHELETVTMSVEAAKEAMARANKTAADIDMVILSTANIQRSYPATAIEVQQRLGIQGFAYDMTVACSSATFGLINAYMAVKAGIAKCALVVNPEFATPQVNLKSRDSHFIFGDGATAIVIERAESCTSKHAFKILDTKQFTQFSNNIRCEGSYTDHCFDNLPEERKFFVQEGRKVFKELLPLVTNFIEEQLEANQLQATDLKRMWLHQANINMNMFAVKKLLGRLPEGLEAPVILDEFANVASSGSVIAFHRYQDDLQSGDKGIICSFGAGYSIGSLIVEKV
ncbi:MAG: beta-ketoacyl-ACP synthase III [Venatoribacter sp.]